MNLLVAEHIEKRYAAHLALDDVSIAVKKGTIFGLLGPNGAGKTSLIRIINQITGPDKGKLFFNGEKLQNSHVKKIGYLPEERGLYKKMKVGEQALYLVQLKGMSKKEAIPILKYWFEKFDIHTWWNKKVEELSKGMQQKIQFIITVLHKPELLIFDEPFSGFDPINTNLIKSEILKLKDNGTTIIFSTHNMESVEELCDEIALINKSRVILDGNMAEIRDRFRTFEFEIVSEESTEMLKGVSFDKMQIISSVQKSNQSVTRVKTEPGTTANELLAALLPHIRIRSFNEIIPRMNDIFISLVEADSNKLN
ncbi:MAG: ATP-binding cassette domain-containing protein [Bacteroidetes bacterium]|nr:ATP-binding cassette domain-containing protein [Bacteroidota bacterium]